MMRQVLAIAAKDLRQRLRDRSAFVLGFLVPFGLAGIFSLTLANVDDGDISVTFAVVDDDGGPVAAAFGDTLQGLEFAETRPVATTAEAERLAGDGSIDAAFVLPEGLSAEVGGDIRVITNPRSDVGGAVARSIARRFVSDVNAVRLSVAAASAFGESEAAALAERAAEVPEPAMLDQNTSQGRALSATTFYAIGMAVFFVFFTVEFGVRSVIEEREQGTLARLMVAPLRPRWIIGGKVLASLGIGLASMAALVLASTLLLGASWGNPLAVALLALGGVASAVSVTAVVVTLAKTSAQASGYTSVAAVVLGLFGGTFFPVSQGPAFMANLSLLTPQAWMMRGFSDVATGGGVRAALPALAALATFAAVVGWIAVTRARRVLAT